MTDTARVAVIGGGVNGLTIAHELAVAGIRVTVHRDAPPADTVSAVAAAIWFPFEASPMEEIASWSLHSRARFEELAADAGSGVRLLPGVIVQRIPGEPVWRGLLADARPATADELPVGAPEGWVATLPVIEMPIYLSWLERACSAVGVDFVDEHVESVDDLADMVDAVVVAGGLASAALVADSAQNYPIRGQVVRVADPGIRRWLLDTDGDDGITYVVPRSADVVVGGTADRAAGTEPDAEVEVRILARAIALVPELAGAPVLSRVVGLRPGRAEVRVEAVEGHAVPVVACYGHGGSGVTTSWGCAATVVALLDLEVRSAMMRR